MGHIQEIKCGTQRCCPIADRSTHLFELNVATLRNRCIPRARYVDTGEEIPDVPRHCLRVLTLTPGMRVEARYASGPDFYPGTINGVNQRYVVCTNTKVGVVYS